jgi:DNA-binding ferritin-like protein
MENFSSTYRLKRPVTVSTDPLADKTAALVSELMNAAVSTHKLHLKVTGPGSFAAHMALGAFYEEIPKLTDAIAEGFQGAHEKLLNCSEEKLCKALYSVEDCVNYMRELYNMVADLQSIMPHSEIVNDLDVIKSLINSTKYKLLFLQ